MRPTARGRRRRTREWSPQRGVKRPPCLLSLLRFGGRAASQVVARPIEIPSAKRLAKPRIRMIVRDRSAPTTPETTANIVMMPSLAP